MIVQRSICGRLKSSSVTVREPPFLNVLVKLERKHMALTKIIKIYLRLQNYSKSWILNGSDNEWTGGSVFTDAVRKWKILRTETCSCQLVWMQRSASSDRSSTGPMCKTVHWRSFILHKYSIKAGSPFLEDCPGQLLGSQTQNTASSV